MKNTNLIEELLRILPYWHYTIEKPLKQSLKDKISLETYYCLRVLQKDGPMTMSALCAHANITKQQGTRLIDALYKHAFVQRSHDTSDRRNIYIEITPQAIAYLDSLCEPQKIQSKLCKEDQETLLQAVLMLGEVLPKIAQEEGSYTEGRKGKG